MMFFTANKQVGINKYNSVTILTGILLLALIFSCKDHEENISFGHNSKAAKYVLVNGTQLYIETYGKGEPLVLLHGNGGSINDMIDQIPFFAERYNVIAIDSRGQGNSKDYGDSLTYDVMAEDVNAILTQLKLDSAFVIGQSDGAITGLILAARYPNKVK